MRYQRLAYEAEVPVWWCEGCKAVLANEEVKPTARATAKATRTFTVVRCANGF